MISLIFLDPVQVRLVGGSRPSEGRLEVLYNNVWGSVCNHGFHINEGNVVCRQLNYSGVISVDVPVPPGVDPIWLDNVSCAGWETSIAECDHRGWGSHDCDHMDDVGLRCFDLESQAQGMLINAIARELFTYLKSD